MVYSSNLHGATSLEAQGSYNTLDFVVRLRPDLHQILEAQGGELSMRKCDSWDAAKAFSTYFHETVHWWQHVGTSAGLMLSFLQPAHAHMNRKRLGEVLVAHGPVKPLIGLFSMLTTNKTSPSISYSTIGTTWSSSESLFLTQLTLRMLSQMTPIL